MSENKNKKTGGMYPWVDEMISHLHGKCTHKCGYCYVPHTAAGRVGLYDGPLSLSERSFEWQPKKSSETIFIDHMNDLFQDAVPNAWIRRVMDHCETFARCTMVFQTKNPKRLPDCMKYFWRYRNHLVGVTLETDANLPYPAPQPVERYTELFKLPTEWRKQHLFITIEPIMQFNLDRFAAWIALLQPAFVNVGANSKNVALPRPEPSKELVLALVKRLQSNGIQIREKHNLERILA